MYFCIILFDLFIFSDSLAPTELAECEDQFTFKLLFHGGGGRTYVLVADSQESLEEWMKALARASYDYLKLMVNELQKQLDELNGGCPLDCAWGECRGIMWESVIL